MEAIRDNKNKLRFDLTPQCFTEGVAGVFEYGAKKYTHTTKEGKLIDGSLNWQNDGNATSLVAVMQSLERHTKAIQRGEDFDKESGLMHIDHIGANAAMVKWFYKYKPIKDTRKHSYLISRRIVLDVDEVLAGFTEAYCDLYNVSTDIVNWNFNYEIAKNLEELKTNKDFWINLPVIDRPSFEPFAYVSARNIPVEWTEEWLQKNNLPCSQVIHVKPNESKLTTLLKLQTDIFVDDKFETFKECNRAGIPTYLKDAGHNRKHEVGYKRLFKLDDLL